MYTPRSCRYSVCVSPDGKHVYVTAELNQSIAIFERNSKMP